MSIFFSLCFITPLLAADPPTMGWSSWNTYRVNISDSLICRQADALVSTGLATCGYRYVNIDDGYFGGRRADGQLLAHKTRFPKGLKPVVDYIHSLGLKAGIYSDAGRNTCGSFWDNDSIGIGVGLYGHDHQDAHLFFDSLRFDFIKIDFCGGDAKQNFEHLQLSERERYMQISQAIRAVRPSGVRINICRWAFPGTWAHEAGASWRISQDISASWESVRDILAQNRYLSAYARNGAYNDMDMLEIGRGLSEAEERTHFAMWCVQSSPLLIGCDLTSIPVSSLKLISNPELIAVNQDVLGLQAAVCKVDSGVYLYVKDVQQKWGLSRVLAICNPSDKDRTVSWAWSDIQLADITEVRDLIDRESLMNVLSDSMSITIPARDTRVYRVTARQRLMQDRYEAETAWLERYQELGMNPELGYPIYSEDVTCSAGAKVSYLGKHPNNRMEWRDVYVPTAGVYELRFKANPLRGNVAHCLVNGQQQASLKWTDQTDIPRTQVYLKQGENVVCLSNNDAWMPDIDCMEVEFCSSNNSL